jgi:hypothetical protein
MNVAFNHLYITLDAGSVEAVGASEFLATQFCKLERASVEADGERWTGTYLLGKRSYLELFEPGGWKGEGFAGIAFSTRRMGQIDDIEERLEKLLPGKVRRNLRVRKGAEGELPWFHTLYIEGAHEGGFAVWLMEYHPEYLASKGIRLGECGCIDRAAYLWPEPEKEPHQLLFEDMLEVEVEVTAEEHANLGALLRALGYAPARNGEVARYRSEAFRLKVREVPAPTYRIRKAVCSLTGGAGEERELSFGDRAMLSVKQGSALWWFDPNNRFRG